MDDDIGSFSFGTRPNRQGRVDRAKVALSFGRNNGEQKRTSANVDSSEEPLLELPLDFDYFDVAEKPLED